MSTGASLSLSESGTRASLVDPTALAQEAGNDDTNEQGGAGSVPG